MKTEQVVGQEVHDQDTDDFWSRVKDLDHRLDKALAALQTIEHSRSETPIDQDQG